MHMGTKREWRGASSSYCGYTFCLGVIPSRENLLSKSSDWGLPPRWKNYILAFGIFPTRRSHLKTKDQIRFKDRNHTSSRQGRLKKLKL